MTLSEKAAKVKSHADLVKFLGELRKDQAKGKWENGELAQYLSGLEGFAGDLEGWFANRKEKLPAQPTWSLMAQVLLAASLYE